MKNKNFILTSVLLVIGVASVFRVSAETLVWNESNWNQAQWSTPVVLRVNRTGSGEGLVLGNGIDCGAACEVELDSGTLVELDAHADVGSYFIGWSHATCSVAESCQFRIMQSSELSADFIALSTSDPEPIDVPVYQDAQDGRYAESAPIAIRGINGPVVVTVNNGEISLNCTGEYISGEVLLYPGDTICVRHFVDGNPGQTIRTTLTIGNYSFEFVSVVERATQRRRNTLLNLIILLEQ
ncbi:MAG: hypothetical protein LAT77_10425 [Aliidiomarina sp.]|uniref:hypothetical protein n=1 Tax=Aliidiomarina sp. TaxID=1872439 RepID=UPI0025B89E67|nr:hypothetical protein [Aliidiomarina sp.]MCH8502310.1 hypothetical protein [Aliidiomarina sp.]